MDDNRWYYYDDEHNDDIDDSYDEYDFDDYDDEFDDDFNERPAIRKKRKPLNTKSGKRRGRKGLKWVLIDLFSNKITCIALIAVALILVIILLVSSCGDDNKNTNQEATTQPTIAQTTQISSYQIEGVPLIVQDKLKAACETYACTMLLQYYKFDIDEFEFVEKYLVTKPVYYGADGTMYGPDMNSAYAGDIYTGYGINAIGMAKFMNNYLKTTGTNLVATPLEGVSLDDLCKQYIVNDTPVMVWATTYMYEPYVFANWIVDFADEDSPTKVGDTVSWQMHEHCLVLVGFDEQNYYFCDSVSGKVSAYDKATSIERYKQIGTQAIVLK